MDWVELNSEPRDLAAQLESFHDSERREGVVGSVEQLPRCKVGRSPVAGGDALRLGEALLEHCADGGTHADLSNVTLFAEDVVEVENCSERDAESGLDLSAVVLQSEPDL